MLKNFYTMGDRTFARYFDAQYRSFEEDLPLWRYLAVEHGSPVLELGCGTGRVLRALIEAGHHTVGIDHDRQMLLRAWMHLAPAFDENTCLVQADLQSYAFGLPFNLAIAPMNTLSIFDVSALEEIATNVRKQLSPEGTFAFELPNPAVDPFDEVDPDEPLTGFIEPESGNPCQVYAQRVEHKGQSPLEIHWHYDELLADGSSQRYTLRQAYFLHSYEDIESILIEAGYIVDKAFGDYTRAPFNQEANTMILVARVRP
jgi:SAM-dependent methyltransferase